ncbi:hypothetical protein MTBBW1_270002 [Desulfamplus magnetovallimortis]|uniref:Uncharacterized protein n=1 Tax=Desulfamplus magnetovallimortis TaxID=1246637 RepID=A0A1W1HF33_9BACT|nr:hypothetical protein MTBBW1_270002 [Desulfamplus magnetovallimortis]
MGSYEGCQFFHGKVFLRKGKGYYTFKTELFLLFGIISVELMPVL